MTQNEAEFIMKISMDFTARAVTRCSKACVTSIKSPIPTDAERSCVEYCVAKHTKLFGEGLSLISKMGQGPQ